MIGRFENELYKLVGEAIVFLNRDRSEAYWMYSRPLSPPGICVNKGLNTARNRSVEAHDVVDDVFEMAQSATFYTKVNP